MSVEERVFSIPGLRLMILEYYLDKTIKKIEDKPNCLSSIKSNISNLVDGVLLYILIKVGLRFSVIR